MDLEIKPLDKFHSEIYLEGQFFAKIHKSIFNRAVAFPKFVQDREAFTSFFSKKEIEGARNFLARSLGKKNLHSFQASKKLRSLFVSEMTAAKVISEFIQKGYLDDERFLAAFVASATKRGRGFHWIKYKFKEMGLQEDEILGLLIPQDNQDKLQELILKKTQKQNLKDPKVKKRVFAFLMRRGFTFEDISKALSIETADIL